MLPIYGELAESALKKINKNVYCMIELFLSSCEGLDYETFLEEIFPSFYLRNNIEVCKNIVMELKGITRDSFKRDYLKPIFEYALYMLVEWWIDVTDDIELLEKIEPDEVYTDEEEIIELYNDVKNYKAILFEDWDFLDIPEFFERYKENPKICTEIFHIDLDEYVDLMPDDIKEEYLLLRNKQEIVVEKDMLIDDETFIINCIYNQLPLLTLRANFLKNVKSRKMN